VDLNSSSYSPYNKPGNTPLYVHANSNHPPQVLRNILLTVNKRLSAISSNEENFKRTTGIYQKALQDSGYNYELKYTNTTSTQKKKTRKRNITWYNPPYNKSVKTNIGRAFLDIIKTSFPPSHILHKIFNKNTVKLSYSCTTNMENLISTANKNKLQRVDNPCQQQQPQKACNCRVANTCPLNGNCLDNNIIYQATVKTQTDTHTYIGLAETSFKARYRNHVSSFNNERYRNSTELSKHVWNLKDQNIEHNITWTIVKHARPYNPISKHCDLCLTEKFFIICRSNMCSLNKRNELASSCRHRFKHSLASVT
jgi:hypothetical protein